MKGKGLIATEFFQAKNQFYIIFEGGEGQDTGGFLREW